MRCVFCIVLVWASCLQQTQCANPYHGAMSTPFERMVHHDDDFRDAFPFSMSEEVHRRVLHLRNLLLLHDTDFDAVRGTRPVKDDHALRRCHHVNPEDHEGDSALLKPHVVGHVFTDGLGHSLVSFLRQLYIAQMYGCGSTLPRRFTVLRNFVFLPWDADTVGSVSSGEDLHALHPRNLSLSQRELLRRNMTWLQRDPTRFLYCHQRHTTVQFKNLVDPDTFLLSSEFRDNMACYVFYVDPWRVLCRAALGNPCPTEMEEIRAYKGDFHRAYDDGGTRHRAVEEVANTKLDHKRMLRHLSNNKTKPYIILDRMFPRDAAIKARVPIKGLPNPNSKHAEAAVHKILQRTRSSFWHEIKQQRKHNVHSPANVNGIRGVQAMAEMKWDCGYDSMGADGSLDVAIHLRRGDLYLSNNTRDIHRYLPMSHYRQLILNLTAAWKGSMWLQDRYPEIRFFVHSESQALPAPFGFETQLPEFENVTFPSHDEYFADFHQHEKHEVVSHLCPVGNLARDGGDDIPIHFCLNINPLQSLYCMASADVFVASDSYFSGVISVTAPTVKVVPDLDVFETMLCTKADMCQIADDMMIKDDNVNASTLSAALRRVIHMKQKPSSDQ